MTKKRRILVVLATFLFALILVACNGNGETTTDPDPVDDNGNGTTNEVVDTPPATDEQVEIRFTWWGDTLRHDIYNEIADLFEAENPDVVIIREPASWGDYWTRLSTQTAGGNAPTVFGMHPQFISDYALREVLMDLQPFVAAGTIEADYLSTSALDGARVNDQLAGIPKGITFQTFGVNRTLLERFDLEAPGRTEDWTWDDFVQLAEAFTGATTGEDLFFTVDHSVDWVYFRWVARQAGGDIFNESATDLGFTEDVMIEWFEMWNHLRDIGAVPDPATTVEQGQLPWQERRFPSGLTVIQGFPANQLLMQQTHAGDDNFIDMVRVPMAGNETRRAENLELPMLSVSSNATPAEADAAARFINFFVNRPESLEIFLMEQGVPVNTQMVEHISDRLEPAAIRTVEIVEAMLPYTSAGVYPPLGASEIDALFRSVAEGVLWGQLAPEQAAADFFSGAAEILERNQ